MSVLRRALGLEKGAATSCRVLAGLRKVRAAQREVRRGKRGGVRVYYLDLPRRGVTHLVAIFGKREKSDLSRAERQAVAALVRQLKEEP